MGDINETHRQIKQSYRLLMNGVTAQSLREKGLDYHLNWGANLLHLREMAAEYEPSYDLALALWKDNIRESKILASMLMPPEEFPYDLAMLWIEQTLTQEIAEITAKNLYSKLFYAKDLALQLIAQPSLMLQLHGYCIMGSISELNDSEINEFLDQAISVLQEPVKEGNLPVKHAAMNAIRHFAYIDDEHEIIAKGALKFANLENIL